VNTYHFQVRTESHVALSETAELEGLEAARIEAAKRIGTLLNEHARQLWVDEDWRMDVTDDTGLILFAIHVSVSDAAATMGSKKTERL
jgi:hypothetical protein